MKRIFKISYGEKTPDYYYYPTKERSPSYVMGIKLKANCKKNISIFENFEKKYIKII